MHHIPRPKLQVNMAFGKQRKITPVVKIICSPLNVAECHKCEQQPLGDYWHNFEDNLDLCRTCMNKINNEMRSCSANETQRKRLHREKQPYELVRYCGFFHDHGGTSAATQLIPMKTLKFKIKTENYLSLYV